MKLLSFIIFNILCLMVYIFEVDCESDDAMIYGLPEAVVLNGNSTAHFGSCSSETLRELHDLKRSCECKPRKYLVDIGLFSPSSIVYPTLAEVNYCAGSCQGYIKCVSTETKPLMVRIQKFDFFIDPYKPICGSIQLQEDASCQCKCLITKDDCHENQVFHQNACKCICPNAEEEKQCFNEGNKWNSTNCTCLNNQ